ncbi:hypothetical protein QYE76_009751 [Lolium multiflorum]|uniref:Reverse transcriptase zinc-binding domain-containing protein n=1 Tax=Lolium multiflorum TaxID=4521 RepID=A0AAD8TVX1_LOLMU|nr:hypothetical protein QYE76_009751 [Lolium multiflorum]
MVDWATVCKPREFGGLGILNTKFMNIALMLKWIWKIYQNEEGLWADLLRAKYLGDHDLFSPVVPTKGSQFWNAIQKIKWYFKLGAKHQVVRLLRQPLCDCSGVRSNGGWRIRFRRSFGLAERVEWDNLCRIFDLSPASEGNDVVRWALEQSGEYSTRSMYSKFSRGGTVTHFKEIWRTRVLPKIRVFLWQLIRGRLPSGDQLVKRHGPSNGRCALCGDWETCDHIFFTCHIAKFMWAGIRDLLSCSWNPAGAADFIAIANGLSGRLRRIAWFTFAAQCWTLWNIRNKLAIEGSLISSPADVIFKMSIYMQSWRVLVRPRDKPLLDVALDETLLIHYRNGALRRRPAALGVATPGPRRRLRRRQPSAYLVGVQVPRRIPACPRRRSSRRSPRSMPTVKKTLGVAAVGVWPRRAIAVNGGDPDADGFPLGVRRGPWGGVARREAATFGVYADGQALGVCMAHAVDTRHTLGAAARWGYMPTAMPST